MTPTTAALGDPPSLGRQSIFDALGPWLVARVVVAMAHAVGHSVTSALSSGGGNQARHVDEGLLTWDGDWYRQIVESGYGSIPAEARRFFPLYPMLSEALSVPLGGAAGIALVLVANAASLVALILLRELVAEVTGDDQLAKRSMWWMALFPAGAVMVMAYGESMMLSLSLAGLLALRRDRYGLAAASFVLCSLTRPTGLLLMVPVAWELLVANKDRSVARLGKAVAVIVSPAIGIVSYLAWVGWRFGDPMEPIDIQRQLRAGFQDPATRVIEATADVITVSQKDGPNLAFALIFIGLLFVSARTLPTSWTLYGGASLLVALSSNNIDSIGRYGMIAFPFIVALAALSNHAERYRIGLALSSAGLLAVTVIGLVGTYTP